MHSLIQNVAADDLDDFHERLRPRCSEILGKTLGTIGAGAIGGRVIQLARAFGMKVLVYKPSPGSWDDEGIRQVGLAELLNDRQPSLPSSPSSSRETPLFSTTARFDLEVVVGGDEASDGVELKQMV